MTDTRELTQASASKAVEPARRPWHKPTVIESQARDAQVGASVLADGMYDSATS